MVACGEKKSGNFEKVESCLCATWNRFQEEPKGHYCMEARESAKING